MVGTSLESRSGGLLILGVAASASQDEIKNAYRNLAKKLHPELFEDLDLSAELKEFYARFYRCALSDEQAAKLLAGLSPDGKRQKLYNN